MDQDQPPQLTSSDPRPTDIGQTHSADLSPKLEIISQDISISDPPDEIHEDPWPLTRLGEAAVKSVASPTSSPPVTSPEKIKNDISSLHTGIPDSCDEGPVTTVPAVIPSSPVNPGESLSAPQTPKRSASRARSRSRSRSSSPSLLSSPLTRLSSSPIREEETGRSTPESELSDVETTCNPIKTSVKRRSIGGADFRAFKKSRVETASTDSAVDIEVEEQPASKPRRKAGKKSARSLSPSPCPEPSLAHTDTTETSDTADLEPTDQSLMGMVVEALAMTRASSMDVDSIRKIVVVSSAPSSHSFSVISLIISSIGHPTLVEDGAYQPTAQADALGDSRLWSKSWLFWFHSIQRQGWDFFTYLESLFLCLSVFPVRTITGNLCLRGTFMYPRRM